MLYQLSWLKWDKVFKNGPSKICGGQVLKNLKWYGLLGRPYDYKSFKGCLPQIWRDPFLNNLSQMIFQLWYACNHDWYKAINHVISNKIFLSVFNFCFFITFLVVVFLFYFLFYLVLLMYLLPLSSKYNIRKKCDISKFMKELCTCFRPACSHVLFVVKFLT